MAIDPVTLQVLANHAQAAAEAMAGRLFGVEALMRWTRADGTAVPPGDFIQVAEDSGFIHTSVVILL